VSQSLGLGGGPRDYIVPGIGRFYEFNGRKHISVTTALKLIADMGRIMNAAKKRHHAMNGDDYPWKQYTSDAMLVGTYLHWRIAVDLADQHGLPYPEFEPKRPIPDITYVAWDAKRKLALESNRVDEFEAELEMWATFKKVCKPRVVNNGLELFLHHPTGYAGRVDCVLALDPISYKEEVTGYRQHFNCNQPKEGEVWIVDLKSSKAIYEDYPAQVFAYQQAWNHLYPREPATRMGILRMNGVTGWEFYETNGDPATWNKAMAAARKKGLIA